MNISSKKNMRPRIAYLNFSNNGGMLHYVINLAEAAAEYVDITYIDVGKSPTPEYVETGNSVLFFRWPSGNRLTAAIEKYRPRNYRALASRIVADVNPDIIHITSTATGLLSLIQQLRKLGVIVVYTIHDPQPHHEQRTLWGTLYTFYQQHYQSKKAYEYCDSLHVHSNLHVDIIRKLYGPKICKKTYMVAHGGGATAGILDGTRIPSELLTRPLNNKVRFLFFGRIEPYKGLKYLFRAQDKLEKAKQPCEIVVAGSGALPPDTAVPHNTIMINRFIADDEIRALFEHSHIVVLPYTEATQSGVIPLAYHFGKPVICTKVGALPEMVIDHESGILIPPNDVDALAEAMQSFISDDRLVENWGQRGRRLLDEKLSWCKVVKEHYEHYLNLCHSKIDNAASVL